jgi:DNA-binding CsgD family transcriptional regulator
MTGPLEREAALDELSAAAREAVAGLGSVTVVHGEAGIGKTSLVAAFRERWHEAVRVLVGYCDDLATPRALGPIRDLIPFLGPDLARALQTEDRERIFVELRTEFGGVGPATILIIEDLHWADEATFDVLSFLVRRIADLPLALVLTYRDDSIADENRLRLLLGKVAGADRVRKIALEPLSRGGVRLLCANSPVDADWLHAVTAGNPFFVTEMLRFGTGTQLAPPTVIDGVLARSQQLSAEVRAGVEQLAVIPSAVERWLLESLVPAGLGGLRAAERVGLIVVTPERVSFRHELTRRAIADSLPSSRQVELNARVLAALVAGAGADPSRLVHHAVRAGDVDAIVRHGVPAARDAARAGAHRQAVSHYRSVLTHALGLSGAERAEVLEAYAIECHAIAEVEAASGALLEAVELRRGGTDRRALGHALHWLSRVQWWAGSNPPPDLAAHEAIDVLSDVGDDRLLALACSNQAQLHLRTSEYAEAVRYGELAVALARRTDDPAVLSHALNHLGSARWALGDPDAGRSALEEALRVALAANETDHVCRAHTNLAWALLDDRRLPEARHQIEAVTERAEATEQLGFLGYARGLQVMLAFGTSDWAATDRLTEADLDLIPPIARWTVAAVRARVAVRRGDPEADALLAGLAPTKDVQRIGLIAAGRAEAAWLRGDLDAVRHHAEPVYRWARRLGHNRLECELGHWLSRAGLSIEPNTSLDPYALQDRGRPLEAAARWEAMGMPYEQAVALAESEQPDQLLVALRILDRLGARPLARMVRDRLRRQGVTRVPRGPNATSRRNPDGLTHRQVEVAHLLAGGRSNAEIAASLVLSVRTVDNHVAAVLTKLHVRRRQEVRARLGQNRLEGS